MRKPRKTPDFFRDTLEDVFYLALIAEIHTQQFRERIDDHPVRARLADGWDHTPHELDLRAIIYLRSLRFRETCHGKDNIREFGSWGKKHFLNDEEVEFVQLRFDDCRITPGFSHQVFTGEVERPDSATQRIDHSLSGHSTPD